MPSVTNASTYYEKFLIFNIRIVMDMSRKIGPFLLLFSAFLFVSDLIICKPYYIAVSSK